MLKNAFKIPKPRMGFFFENRPSFFDSSRNAFLNVFKGSAIQDCDMVLTSGAVNFQSDFGSNERSCVRLNDSAIFEFRQPIPFQGTMVIIARVDLTGGSGTRNYYPILCNNNANGNVVPNVRFGFFSGNASFRHTCGSSGVQNIISGFSHGPEEEFLFAGAFDQARREAAYILNDGAPAQGTTSAVTANGNAMAFGGLQKARFGDIDNDNTVSNPALADHLDVAALLFYGGNAVKDAEASVDALYAEANQYYGLRYSSS